MLGINRGVLLGLWAATIVAAFVFGRATPPTDAAGAPEDLGASVRSALGEGGSLERAARTATLMQYLDADSLPEVVAVYDRMLSGLDECDIRPFVDAWTRFDPTAALDHTLSWPFANRRQFGVDAAIRGWALRDPFEALLVYEQVGVDHPSLREGIFKNLVVGWAQSGQRGLDSYLAGLSPLARDEASGLVVGGLLRKGGAEPTLRWADTVLGNDDYDANFKKSAFRRAARSVARWYPERAAKWVVEHQGKSYADQGVRFVAEFWADRDGLAAMRWVLDQPAGKFRDEAMLRSFNRWSVWDPQGAEKWLLSETLTESHDPAIDTYARRIGSQMPREAVGWCERIADTDRRYGCLKVSASAWYWSNAVAAEEWMQTSPLSEDDRRAVRTPKARKKRARGAANPRAADGPG